MYQLRNVRDAHTSL
ncbi:hypothetical protein LINGRAHAP2_LOCUS1904 [Linum grandiflorum]